MVITNYDVLPGFVNSILGELRHMDLESRVILSVLKHVGGGVGIATEHSLDLLVYLLGCEWGHRAIVEVVPFAILETSNVGVIVATLGTTRVDQNGEELIDPISLF